jgi:RNA-directed DNA polymerase
MRRHGNLWMSIISLENLDRAYQNAIKGKRNRVNIQKIEHDSKNYITELHIMLKEKRYTTSPYKIKKIYEPKERNIFILPFYPDRIVQHALLQVLIPIWDVLMIYDSYACRSNKGMHKASQRTMDWLRQYKYCFKADIKKFYPSIDHEILKRIIQQKIKCPDTLWLINDIIDSCPGGKNTPIGNYTSQWFGNLYLNEMDMMIKHYHKQRAYIRYNDDFVIFSNDKIYLHYLKNWITCFLWEKLKLKFSRWSIFPVKQGVDFLGYRHFPNYILVRKSTIKRVKKRMAMLPHLLQANKITREQYQSSIASTKGWLQWANAYHLQKALNLI